MPGMLSFHRTTSHVCARARARLSEPGAGIPLAARPPSAPVARDGRARVIAVDPMEQLARGDRDLADLATEVRHRLEKVVAAV
jgi:hypothetical protein